jgi:hypothetical protein
LATALTLCLSACGQQPSASPADAKAKVAGARIAGTKPRRCPDPDIRDARDPCSVAYLRRSPPRFAERDPLR